MPTQKIDPKVIFASDAPTIDKPPVFSDKTKGWDVARANDGRPEIKQMNKMQQDTDLKILWLNENAVLPYDLSIDYPDGAVTLKDGSFKQLSSGLWVEFLDDFADKDEVKRGIANRYNPLLTYNSGERVVLINGDIVKSIIDGNSNDPNVNMAGWVSIGNLIIVSTVAELVTKNLKNGDVVKTLGYNNLSDNGGALYVISDTATDYSISLSNGLNAIFCDDFDIRKFGIQDNAALDQTAEFTRMIAYADTREYEIDFHNFSVMTPLMTDMGFNSILFKGMIFNSVHKLKNLKVANNKTTQLQQNTCQIVFMPKANVSVETLFELDNVIFDPYVANYNITSGSYDGNMHGFIAHPHIDSGITWWRTKTMYSFKFKNIAFTSAAISYNLTPSAIYAERVIVENCSGDYIGLFCNHFANKLEVDGCYGVYRDDLHAAGRVLVTSLLHEEPETRGTGTIDPVQAYHKIKNISSIKKSTGLPHLAYKHHSVTKHTLDLLQVEKAVGQVFTFGPITGVNTTINKLVISECDKIDPECYVKSATISNSNALSATMLRSTAKVDVLTLNDVTLIAALSTPAIGASNVQQLNLNRVNTTDATYGFVRNALVNIDVVSIKDCKILTGRAFECKWSVMNIDGFEFKDVAANNAFFLKGATSVGVINAVNIKNTLPAQNFAYHFMADAGASLNVNIRFSDFGVRPAISNAVLNFGLSTPNSASITYDPPSLAAAGSAGDSVTTTVTLTGATLGSVVQAGFSQYNAGVEITAQVSAVNTVTVKFKNTGASAVDLASGTIIVKLI